MSEQNLLYWMKRTRAFSGFSHEELSTMGLAFSLRPAPRGQMIFREGTAAPSFFIVARGTVRIVRDQAHGAPLEIGRLGSDQVLGVLALLDGGRREATAQAATDVVLIECHRDQFERLLKTSHPFAFRLLDFIVVDLSSRLREANAMLDNLLSQPGQTLANLYDQMVKVGRKIHESGQFTPA